MGVSITTEDGFTITVVHSLYVDYGLLITKRQQELFYSPCCLSREIYGSKPNPKFENWDDAEAASLDGDDTAFVPWTDADWEEHLKEEADVLVETFVQS